MTDIKEQYLEELIIYPKIAAVTQLLRKYSYRSDLCESLQYLKINFWNLGFKARIDYILDSICHIIYYIIF